MSLKDIPYDIMFSGNGVESNKRRQAILLVFGDPVHWNASPDPDALTSWHFERKLALQNKSICFTIA